MSSIMFEEMNESVESFGSTFEKVEFNASLVVTELLAKTLENCAKELASRCIKECASRHGFDATEEIRVLGLENLALIRKQMAKKPKGEKKATTEKKVKGEKKAYFPLPFNPDTVDFSKCNGLAYNRGLFTQCPKEQMANSCFCKGCQAECDSSATGIPSCGTVQQRLATNLYEFKDPKGRNPVRYLKVLEKAKILPGQAIEEAGKLSIVINEEHFVLPEKKASGPKGRPKKTTGTVEADNVTDLFAKLTAVDNTSEVFEEAESAPKSKKSKLTEEEKEAKKAALEAERAAKKQEREAKLAEEKEEREAKRKAEAEIKKLEREAKLAAEKAERETKRQLEKAEKEAKKAAEKAAKEAEKAAKEANKKKKTDTPSAAPASAPPVAAPIPAPAAPVPAPATGKISVKRIQIGTTQYLQAPDNTLYNPETKEKIGIFDEATKTIKPLPKEEEIDEEESDEEESDEEESEEEYESDAN